MRLAQGEFLAPSNAKARPKAARGQPTHQLPLQRLVASTLVNSALVFSLLVSLASTQSEPSAPHQSANDLARRVIANELKAEDEDHTHWMFRLQTEKSNRQEVYEVVESKDGDLKRLIAVNGQPLSPEEQKKQDERIQYLVNHPDELRKAQRAQEKDEARSQRLLKTLPDALMFTYGQRRGDLVQLTFKPNPSFRPSFHEAQVFHAMEGSIWVSSRDYRLSEINGHLTHEVKFGGGLLGHLDRGGKFHVKQEEVAPRYWELTLLNVDMRGKALFFKTITVEEKLQRSSLQRVPDDLTLAQAAELLEKQIRTANKPKISSPSGARSLSSR